MSTPLPKYSLWEALGVALAMGTRALEEIRGLALTPGPPGRLPVVRGWTDRIYYEGDAVAFEGATFQALRDTGKAPGGGDWICIAERGVDGGEGPGFTPRGTWAVDGEYGFLDVVALNGASFSAKRDAPGPCPGDGWQLQAAQGKQGKHGERGARGERGEPGAAGAVMVAGNVDAGTGIVTFSNSDGSEFSVDFYSLLSRFKGHGQ